MDNLPSSDKKPELSKIQSLDQRITSLENKFQKLKQRWEKIKKYVEGNNH